MFAIPIRVGASTLLGAAAIVFLAASPVVGQQGGEWTFEEAAKHWRPMVRAVEHVGIPGYPFQAAVLWDGSLVFGPLSFRELTVMQKETAPLGDNLLHVAVGYGEPMRWIDRRGTRNPAIRSLRFLDESSSLLDDAALLSTLPSGPFLEAVRGRLAP